MEYGVGTQRELAHRAHAAGGGREGVVGIVAGLLVKYLHEGDTARPTAVDEGLHVAQEDRQILLAEVGAPAEGFLDVDDDQSLLHDPRPSVKIRQYHRAAGTAVPQLRQTSIDQKRTSSAAEPPGPGPGSPRGPPQCARSTGRSGRAGSPQVPGSS